MCRRKELHLRPWAYESHALTNWATPTCSYIKQKPNNKGKRTIMQFPVATYVSLWQNDPIITRTGFLSSMRNLCAFMRWISSRGRVTVTRQAHNLKIVGAIPAPATSYNGFVTATKKPAFAGFFVCLECGSKVVGGLCEVGHDTRLVHLVASD